MRLSRVAAGTAAYLLASCASGGAGTTTTTSAPAAAAPTIGTAQTLVATMVPTNASGNRITGRIRLVPTARPDELMAEIDLRGGAYQNKHAWVVRGGQCGDVAQDVGTTMTYRLIETRGDGMAQMKVPVRITIPSGTHHIAIFPDATNRNVVVSCGVLSPEK